MAKPDAGNPTGRTPSTDVPAIRTFQFDRGEVGDAANGVNLFRGTLTYPLNLVTLPGRNGLDVSIDAVYQANLGDAVERWNADAPTGTMGLGWAPPFESIVLDDRGTSDRASNRYYLVSRDTATSIVLDGGRDERGWLTCQTVPHEFWRVAYDPDSETWEIVKEDGSVHRYGGKDDRGAVQWGVCWGEWIGASSLAAGQQRYAVGWNLAEVESLDGDKITYAYDNIEQNVGHPGDDYKSYTKASYLRRITDVFGRTATFRYADKVFDLPGGVCEYQDPQRRLTDAAMATTPDAYQSRYETRYLEAIEVADAHDEALFTVRFAYDVRNLSGQPTSSPDYAFFAKRYLTGVTMEMPDGSTLPGYAFEYYGRTVDGGNQTQPNPGALRAITFPDGGLASYTYEAQDVLPAGGGDPQVPLRYRIDAPLTGDLTPRVWHGPDYTVVTWHGSDAKVLALSAYRWLGRWSEYRPSDTFKADVLDDSLRVVTQEDFFCVTWTDASTGQQAAHLYRKDPEKFGSWTHTQGTVTIGSPTEASQVAGGDDFVMFCNPARTAGPFWGWRWSWQQRAWRQMTTLPSLPEAPTPRLSLAAARNSYVATSFVPGPNGGKGTLSVARVYQDPAQSVGEGWTGPVTISAELTVHEADKADGDYLLLLSMTDTAVVATYVTNVQETGEQRADYELRAFSWDRDNRFVPTQFVRSYSSAVHDDKLMFPILATFVRGSLIGNSGNVARYVGGFDAGAANNWATFDRPGTPEPDMTFAYGDDAAFVRGAQLGDVLVTFDPSVPSSGGFAQRHLDPIDDPGEFSGGYLTLGGSVYTDVAGSNWAKLAQALPAGDHATTSNRGPSFAVFDAAGGGGVVGVFFRNGRIAATERYDDPAQRVSIGDDVKPGPGTLLVGGTAFVTYPADTDLDHARTLYLHRVVGQTAKGPVRAVPIVRAEMADPSGDAPAAVRTFTYDQATVAYDPAAALARYSKVTVEPVDAAAPDGRTVSYFSNGVSTDAATFYPPGTPLNYHNLLTGQLLRREQYAADGTLVAASTYTYQVMETAEATPGGSARNIAGAWVRIAQQQEVADGVRRTTTTTYSPYSGFEMSRTSDDVDSSGEQVALRTTTLYAYDVDAYRSWATGRHALRCPVQVTEKTGDAITSVDVTTWKRWDDDDDRWAIAATYKWRGTGDPAFDFGADEPSEDWLLDTRVLVRSPEGMLATEAADVDGRITSTVYDRLGANALATFVDASVAAGEASYYGFEPDEVNPGWAMQPGGGALDIVEDGPHTGRGCLRIAPGDGDAGAQLECTPADQSRSYLLTSWVRTSDDGGAWQLWLLDGDGNAVWHDTVALPATGGAWQQVAVPLDLPGIRSAQGVDGDARLTVRMRCTSGASTAVFLDDLRFSPLLSRFAARVFDPTGLTVVAELGTRGEVRRHLLDRFRRERARTDASGCPTWLGASYLRAHDATGQAAKANADVEVYAAGTGFWDDFSSSDLARSWDTDGAGDWSVDVARQRLEHAASDEAQTLRLRDAVGADLQGAQVEVLPAGTPSAPIELSVGDVAVRWSPEGRWTLVAPDGSELATAPRADVPTGQWMLVGAGMTAAFFFEGRQIFQSDVGSPVQGSCALTATDAVGFSGFAGVSDCGLAATFVDGFGRAVQKHVYGDGGWIARATLYDNRGRKIAATKPVPADSGAFGYWEGLVADVDLDGDGTIGGAVAAYYGPDGGGPSDDEGYPFERTRHEPSPLDRVVERGNPGAALAIDPQVAIADRHTERTSYGPSEQVGDLPPASCYQTTVLDADGNRSAEIHNSRGQLLVRLEWLDDDTVVTTRYDYAPSGQVAVAYPPAVGDGAAEEALRTTFSYDFFGRQTAQTAPDIGPPGAEPASRTSRTMYDRAGRVRFRQTPELADAGDIAYKRYDAQGRVVEEGLVAFDWNEGTQAELQRHADDPAWPGDDGRWRRRYTYDGDGTDLTALLRLTGSSARGSDDGDAEAVEEFTYDLEGQVTTHRLLVPGFDDQQRQVAYGYDGLGRMRSVTQSGADAEFSAYYTLDRLGLVVGIGTSPGAADIASYEYNVDSTVEAVTLATAQPKRQRYAYNSPAWVTDVDADAGFRQQVRYMPDGHDGSGYYNGSPAQVVDRDEWAQQALTVDRTVAYDALGRMVGLTTVTDGQDEQEQRIAYDPRGNILEVTGADAEEYHYEEGTNRVRSTTPSPEDGTYGYDLDGNVTGTPAGAVLTYDAMTGLPRSIRPSSGDEACFAYDAAGVRVLRQQGDGATLSMPGPHNTVLATWRSGDDGGPAFHVYGPGGLVASHVDGALRFYVKDNLGSIRAVLAADASVVAAYRYTPWGTPTAVVGSLADSPFLFTGFEYEAEVGLYYCKVRFYDPRLRRFLGIDPAGEFASPYLYAANNPFRFVDPSGRELTLGLVILIGAIVGAVAGLVAGITTSVTQKWDVGESIWRTLLFTIVGAAFGALWGAAGYGVGAAATSITASAVGQALIRGGANLVLGVGLGAAQGAADSAIAKGNPGVGAEAGAITGLFTALVGWGIGEGVTVLRGASRTDLAGASRMAYRYNGESGMPDIVQVYDSRALAKGAAIQFIGGAVQGGAMGAAATAIEVARGKDDWSTLLQDVLLGATFGALRSGAPVRYAANIGKQQTVLSPSSAIGNNDL